MQGTSYQIRPGLGFGRPWTPMVKILILTNGGVFLAQILGAPILGVPLSVPFGLDTAHPFQLWRYVSYMFLHGGPFHLFFNMFALWIFGSDMEDYFGRDRFLQYYFFTGVGAGLCVMVIDQVAGGRSVVIGASGAVFGLLLAFGVVYAERTITLLLFFVVPVTMRARNFVIIFGVIEFFFGISGATGVAHFAHLGGMAFGYFYLKSPARFSSGRLQGRLKSLGDRIQSARSDRDDRRMDELLRKVNDQGIQSLTDEEKQFLHRVSRRKKWQ